MKNKLKRYNTINPSIRKFILRKIIIRNNNININNYLSSKTYTNRNLESLLYIYQQTLSRKKHFKEKLISKPISSNKNNLKLKNKKSVRSTNSALYNKNFKGSKEYINTIWRYIQNHYLLMYNVYSIDNINYKNLDNLSNNLITLKKKEAVFFQLDHLVNASFLKEILFKNHFASSSLYKNNIHSNFNNSFIFKDMSKKIHIKDNNPFFLSYQKSTYKKYKKIFNYEKDALTGLTNILLLHNNNNIIYDVIYNNNFFFLKQNSYFLINFYYKIKIIKLLLFKLVQVQDYKSYIFIKYIRHIIRNKSSQSNKYSLDISSSNLYTQSLLFENFLSLVIKKVYLLKINIIKNYTSSVISMAKKKYTFNDNLEFEDLIQQGLLGLISSINKFVPDYGYSFDTYSTYWIRQGIQKSVIYKKSMIQIPANKFKRLNYINTIISELESKLKRKPTLIEVSNVTSFPIEKIYEAYTTSTKSMKIISLDRPMFSNDEKSTISDFLDNSSVNQNISADQSYNKILFPLLDKLTPSLSTLLSMRYGITPYKKHTLNELSDVFQLSIKDIAYAIKISLNYLNTFSKSKISS